MALGQRHRRRIGVPVGADGHDGPHPGLASAREHGVQILGEVGEVEMGVGVEQGHHASIIARP
jgi:hypothetical protein